VGEELGTNRLADGGQLLGPVLGGVGVEVDAGVDLVDEPVDQLGLAPDMGVEGVGGAGLRRVTGWLLVVGAVAFAVAATVLSSTFEWPDILREPPEVVLPAFVDGGTSLVWTWFAVAWTYPILLLPAALGGARTRCCGPPPSWARPRCCCR
jgi:hypothetical protein